MIHLCYCCCLFTGSEDIRAHEAPRSSRPYSSYLDSPSTYRSIYDEPATANERVQSSGYRYLPVSRDTYGYSPRAIYDHHYSRTSKSSDTNFKVELVPELLIPTAICCQLTRTIQLFCCGSINQSTSQQSIKQSINQPIHTPISQSVNHCTCTATVLSCATFSL